LHDLSLRWCELVSLLRESHLLCIVTIRRYWRMPSSGIWRRVGILLTDFSEERIASIFKVAVFSYLLTLLHRSWISYTLNMEAIRSSETSVNKISTRHNIPGDGILHSHCRENLKSYIRRYCFSSGDTFTRRGTREKPEEYMNTTEMSEFFFLYPFCTIISRMASLFPMGNFFQATSCD
jgi:hypothetical protein